MDKSLEGISNSEKKDENDFWDFEDFLGQGVKSTKKKVKATTDNSPKKVGRDKGDWL